MTETKFLAGRCITCGTTVLLVDEYKNLGYTFKTWGDLGAAVSCCPNTRIVYEDTIMIEDDIDISQSQIHKISDRVTMVLEDLPPMEEKKCRRKRKENCRTSRRS